MIHHGKEERSNCHCNSQRNIPIERLPSNSCPNYFIRTVKLRLSRLCAIRARYCVYVRVRVECACAEGHAVYADGSICLDILQNQWSPIYDIAAILASIQVRPHSAHCTARDSAQRADSGL
jgi:hypothetical protein